MKARRVAPLWFIALILLAVGNATGQDGPSGPSFPCPYGSPCGGGGLSGWNTICRIGTGIFLHAKSPDQCINEWHGTVWPTGPPPGCVVGDFECYTRVINGEPAYPPITPPGPIEVEVVFIGPEDTPIVDVPAPAPTSPPLNGPVPEGDGRHETHPSDSFWLDPANGSFWSDSPGNWQSGTRLLDYPWSMGCAIKRYSILHRVDWGGSRRGHCMASCVIATECGSGGWLAAAASGYGKELADVAWCRITNDPDRCFGAWQPTDLDDNAHGRNRPQGTTCWQWCSSEIFDGGGDAGPFHPLPPVYRVPRR